MRHTAYRWLVAYCRLSGYGRRPLPRCAVIAIRKKYPDSNGLYVGYLSAGGKSDENNGATN